MLGPRLLSVGALCSLGWWCGCLSTEAVLVAAVVMAFRLRSAVERGIEGDIPEPRKKQ